MAGTAPAAGGLLGELQVVRRQLEVAQDMRRQFELAHAELAETELTGTAGGGLVTVTMSGSGELTQVAFDPAVFDQSDVEGLGALTADAFRKAADAVKSAGTEKLAAALAGLRAAQAEPGTGQPDPGEAPLGPVL